MTTSASAGTSRSTVFAFTTLSGLPTSPPDTQSSSSFSGIFCTAVKETTGGQPRTMAHGIGSPRFFHPSQCM